MVKKSGTSFFWSMRLLPKAKRMAMYTIYAFCRHIDDIVDGDSPLKEKQELLAAWREEINNIYDKKLPTTEIGRKIYKNCMRFKLPKEEFIQMLNSISMDIPVPLCAPNMIKLNEYCSGVAGCPGSLTLRIFGVEDQKLINELSQSLGNALQLTNILRDVKEDAYAGRLYIPEECLNKAGISSRDPLTVLVDKNLSVAREELAQIARADYEYAFELIKKLDKKSAKPIKAMAYIYKRYFDLMQNRGWEIVSPKPQIGKFYKLCLALRAFMGK